MFDTIKFAEIQKQLLEWLTTNVLTPSSGVQAAVLFVAFLIAILLNNIIRPKTTELIDKLRLPFRLTEVFYGLQKLITPFLAIVFIFIGSKIIGPDGFHFPIGFLNPTIKLLWAWMFIRFMAQFIENRFARNFIAFTVLALVGLSIFGVLQQTMTFLDSFGFSLGEFRLSALSVTKGIFGIFILLYGAQLLGNVLDKRISSSRSLTPSSRVLFSKIVRVFLFVTAIIIGITAAGIDLSLFAVFSGAVGLGVGFGLQKVISNLFSGVLLLLDQSIKPGDIIEIDQTFGWVNHMGARYTELVTRDNKSYLVPNEEFITRQVINWSHGNTLVRLETKFRVHFNSDPHLIKKLAVEAASKPDRVVDSPSPVCHLIEFGDYSLNFVLRYWIKDAEKGVVNTRGDVMLALWDTFKEHGIEIPYPHNHVFLHKEETRDH